jgi:hypothetical protein
MMFGAGDPAAKTTTVPLELSGLAGFHLEFISGDPFNPKVAAEWNSLVDRLGQSGWLYQSPQFFGCLSKKAGGRDIALLTISDSSKSLVGIIPLHLTEMPLMLSVRNRRLLELRMSTALVLGGSPLIPPTRALYGRVFAALRGRFKNCDVLRLNAVPTASPLWQYLHESPDIRRHYYTYVPHGPRSCHTTQLPATFEDYLERYSRKKRYNLARQLRLLREHGNGSLELKRIDSMEDVPALLEAIRELRPHDEERTLDHETAEMLAANGWLHSYVLMCGGRPCSVAVGWRFRDKYALQSIAYFPEFRHLSPGTSLNYLLIEDLIRDTSVTCIDYGYGEPVGSYRSTNVVVERGAVLLFRKSLVNRFRIATHSLFHALTNAVKHIGGIGAIPVTGYLADVAEILPL